MNFTYRSVTSEANIVEMQQFPQYRQFLTTAQSVFSRFETTFSSFHGCVFDYSEEPLLTRGFPQSGSTHSLVEAMARKMQEECTTEVLVLFK